MGQPEPRLRGEQIPLQTHDLPLAHAQLPDGRGLLVVRVGPEHEPETDGVGLTLRELDVEEILQGGLILLGDELFELTILQHSVPVAIDYLALQLQLLLPRLQVLGQSCHFLRLGSTAPDEFCRLSSLNCTLSSRGRTRSAYLRLTTSNCISCCWSSECRWSWSPLSATTGTLSSRGNALMSYSSPTCACSSIKYYSRAKYQAHSPLPNASELTDKIRQDKSSLTLRQSFHTLGIIYHSLDSQYSLDIFGELLLGPFPSLLSFAISKIQQQLMHSCKIVMCQLFVTCPCSGTFCCRIFALSMLNFEAILLLVHNFEL